MRFVAELIWEKKKKKKKKALSSLNSLDLHSPECVCISIRGTKKKGKEHVKIRLKNEDE